MGHHSRPKKELRKEKTVIAPLKGVEQHPGEHQSFTRSINERRYNLILPLEEINITGRRIVDYHMHKSSYVSTA